MNEPKRRSLLGGLVATKSGAGEGVEASIAVSAARHGFAGHQATEGFVEAAPRRKRKTTGRTVQFNVRLRPETLEMIYGQSNGRDIPIAQVIEEAMSALLDRPA
jgi:uncharacterized protein YcfJ